MDSLLRTVVFGTSLFTCIAGHAEVRRPCITALEAQPASATASTPWSAAPPKPTMSPKKPCPVAIVYVPVETPERARRQRVAERATTLGDRA